MLFCIVSFVSESIKKFSNMLNKLTSLRIHVKWLCEMLSYFFVISHNSLIPTWLSSLYTSITVKLVSNQENSWTLKLSALSADALGGELYLKL